MKKLILGLAVLTTTTFLVASAVFYVMIELDEVVVLRTNDARGEIFQTRLWVADHAGQAWLIARFPDRRWLARLQTNPRIELVRNGSTQCHLAAIIEDHATREELRPVFTHKYHRAMTIAKIPSQWRALVTSDPQSAEPILISLAPC